MTVAYRISLFSLGATMLRRRRVILLCMLFGAVLAVLPAQLRAPRYTTNASLLTRGVESQRSALSTLAGQFGVNFPTSSGASPALYADLLRTNSLLMAVAADTFTVPELGNRRLTFAELFEINGRTPEQTRARATDVLRDLVSSGVTRTNLVTLTVTTKWPSVSFGIAQRLIQQLNDLNVRMQQSQAADERRFVGERLSFARDSLMLAEERLKGFLQRNRTYSSSPQLNFEYERLQREVGFRQSVVTGLTQSHEEARIRELRDTPVVTVVESPQVPAFSNPRRRILRALLGVLLGFVVATLYAFGSELLVWRRSLGTPDSEEFFGTLREMRAGFRRLSGRGASV
jgi:uncharacterized protein involved in exopolysaccharide biosynthesis